MNLQLDSRRLYLAVAVCALITYGGALWNRFVYDDVYIVALNHSCMRQRGCGEPLPSRTGPATSRARCTGLSPWRRSRWTGCSVARVVSRRQRPTARGRQHARGAAGPPLGGGGGGGTVQHCSQAYCFAVHPVHVEAVAYVVGRSDAMAALFTLLAVYAAVERKSVAWTAAALVGAISSARRTRSLPRC